ncbi:non-hydrolyzing UDP-N-acetylglucosamine 2-epimerase [Gordonia sputi]|uniref:UDP-N-acetylglucosamine 2-epimerase (non-hydrolyzing) n=1 Tax=Gordonia sputi NBRC 100414 TaxID=1089453 RepID=H5U6C4_9ACTN|nr:UDP-N-acetylglucosamine 2-epimerase (non-hydrolyzing) [Gordonia sputi]NKY92190.1 UDP-N-acetylglucosamine 2-epimerase (non-hydrolyzing) [Gordonia sputi]OBA73826.1 UDP-N-acetylglucosamine 2-epimerase [Gordonia sp. 852002-10350_SCH5691597]GAB41282.1 putative UDP-N-acetylglucosamine 2-epimerase [Gordonia sputi NBRC 100414]
MQTVHLVAGTRPEAIKLAPLYRELGKLGFDAQLVASGQHPTMVRDSLRVFGIAPDLTLELDRGDGGLPTLISALIANLSSLWSTKHPDAVVVQGDTTTALAGALAAFWAKIPVVHLEAGLRSHDLHSPFPEEANRKLIGQIADFHLAPTSRAERNLIGDGIPADRVYVTGNTVIDAVLRIAASLPQTTALPTPLILLTMHRRESWGDPLEQVLDAVAQLLAEYPTLHVLCPTHPNPAVRQQVHLRLGEHDRVTLTDPLPYEELVGVMKASTLIISDSGGIQEEAPTFGVPVLVARDVTERIEAIEYGCAISVGTDRNIILTTARRLLDDPEARSAMRSRTNPFGDGLAAFRSAQAIARLLNGHTELPAPFSMSVHPVT